MRNPSGKVASVRRALLFGSEGFEGLALYLLWFWGRSFFLFLFLLSNIYNIYSIPYQSNPLVLLTLDLDPPIPCPPLEISPFFKISTHSSNCNHDFILYRCMDCCFSSSSRCVSRFGINAYRFSWVQKLKDKIERCSCARVTSFKSLPISLSLFDRWVSQIDPHNLALQLLSNLPCSELGNDSYRNLPTLKPFSLLTFSTSSPCHNISVSSSWLLPTSKILSNKRLTWESVLTETMRENLGFYPV